MYRHKAFTKKENKPASCTALWINGFGIETLLNLFFKYILGTECEPKRFSTRIAFLTVFLASLVTFSAYSASLTSFLAVVKVSIPFEDLKSMYESTNYRVGSLGGTAFDDLFKVRNLNFF